MMSIHHTLFCFFFLALQDRNSSSAKEPTTMYGEAGRTFRAHCGISRFGSWKIFCREDCEGGNILIKTDEATAQLGRYKTEFVKAGYGFFTFYVSISELTRSDSGLYRCGVGDSLKSASYLNFSLTVSGAVGPTLSTPTTSGILFSSSGSSTPPVSSGTTVLTQENSTTSQDAPNHTGSANVLQFVTLTLVIIITLLSVALLVHCSKISGKHLPVPPVQTENRPATEKSSRMNEDVREEGEEWRSADVEIYSAYIETTNTKPSEAETNPGCSSVTGTTSQYQVDDDSTKIYAEVKFFNREAASPPRASCGIMADVIYAKPRGGWKQP